MIHEDKRKSKTVYWFIFCVSAGADIVGINCGFDPDICLESLRLMKEALDKEGLKVHLMIQPVGYHTPDINVLGFQGLQETPFGEFISLVTYCL